MNTKQIGELSEAFIVAKLLEAGYSVSRPIGDNQRYDLIIDSDGELYKVQCKTANVEANGSISFPLCSTYAHRGGARKNYLNQVDFVMAYCSETGEVYWEEVGPESPNTKRTLRMTESKMVKDYILAEERTLEKLTLARNSKAE